MTMNVEQKVCEPVVHSEACSAYDPVFNYSNSAAAAAPPVPAAASAASVVSSPLVPTVFDVNTDTTTLKCKWHKFRDGEVLLKLPSVIPDKLHPASDIYFIHPEINKCLTALPYHVREDSDGRYCLLIAFVHNDRKYCLLYFTDEECYSVSLPVERSKLPAVFQCKLTGINALQVVDTWVCSGSDYRVMSPFWRAIAMNLFVVSAQKQKDWAITCATLHPASKCVDLLNSRLVFVPDSLGHSDRLPHVVLDPADPNKWRWRLSLNPSSPNIVSFRLLC